jgi:hypothetical protein
MSGTDDEVYEQPETVGTELISIPDYDIPFTSRRETDCWGALARGLSEYVSQLRIDWEGGASVRLLKVHAGWAEPETLALYPSAVVYAETPGTYDGDSFSTIREVLPDGRSLQRTSEFTQVFTLDVWCTHAEDRMALVAMLEDAFDPVDWMSGFHLRLPHYHNAVGTFLKDSLNIQDSAEQAGRRWRLASFTIAASVPQIRFIGRAPALDIRTVVSVEGD